MAEESNSDGEYAETTVWNLKEVDWNVLESPVFKFAARGNKFAVQLVLVPNQNTRQKQNIACNFDLELNCLKVPEDCHFNSLKVCCTETTGKRELCYWDLSSIQQGSPLVKILACVLPVGHAKCNPPVLDVDFEILMIDDNSVIFHSEKWNFASPWLQISETEQVRVHLTESFFPSCVSFQVNTPGVNWENVFVSVTGFSGSSSRFSRLSDFVSPNTVSKRQHPVGRLGSPLSSLKIRLTAAEFASSTFCDAAAAQVSLPVFEMFKSVISKEHSHSDCSLCIATDVYPVHKAVLAVFPYFQGKFNVDGRESPTVELPGDMRSESVTELIRYLYLRKVENLDSVAEELVTVANELMLDELKQLCLNALKRKLSIENVLSFLVMADRMQCMSLKNCAKGFLKRNVKEVKSFDEEGFGKFVKGNVDLVAESIGGL